MLQDYLKLRLQKHHSPHTKRESRFQITRQFETEYDILSRAVVNCYIHLEKTALELEAVENLRFNYLISPSLNNHNKLTMTERLKEMSRSLLFMLEGYQIRQHKHLVTNSLYKPNLNKEENLELYCTKLVCIVYKHLRRIQLKLFRAHCNKVVMNFTCDQIELIRQMSIEVFNWIAKDEWSKLEKGN